MRNEQGDKIIRGLYDERGFELNPFPEKVEDHSMHLRQFTTSYCKQKKNGCPTYSTTLADRIARQKHDAEA
jgi:hypothetical protein